MKRFFCYEASTDTAYHLGAYASESERDLAFVELLAWLESIEDPAETTATGEAEAVDWQHALDMIRAGQWSYSQKL